MRRHTLAAVLLLPIATLALATATQAQAAAPAQATAVGPESTPEVVTLITGDRVAVTTLPDGQRTYSVQAAPRPAGRPVSYDSYTAADGLHVVPSDARTYLAAKAIDADLFNVDLLAHEATGTAPPPVIITFGTPSSTGDLGERSAAALPKSRPSAILASIGAVATRAEAADAGSIWRELTRPDPFSATAVGRLPRGVTRIWLDRRVHADVNQTVPQLDALATKRVEPGDGRGVRVAVLDTGVDVTHPDFAGRIVDRANFTTEPSIVDGNGHGTYVASILAGSGAASGGRYRGVAPGASLLIGKVLDKNGSGDLSQVIQGMEWAAQNGARVINVSLGAGPTDGTDPGSQAVNALTAQTGALFVVAAGNNGGPMSVNTPGTADAALTVGAVDASDVLADFSSRGPRFGDAAVKPDLVAPGVDIVAARAAGTTLGTAVNRRYTRASGTSMAAPNVAGAAVLLAQRHADWTAERLKAALVSTAHPLDRTPFEAGAGRVDLARAVDQRVYGPGSVSVGTVTTVQRRILTYRNDTPADITLALTVSARGWDGAPAPAGEVALDATTVRIPAGGTASTSLAIDPTATADRGIYTGVVTAEAPDRQITARTTFSLYEPPVTENLTVHALDRRGQPADDGLPVWLYKLDGGVPNDPFVPQSQVAFLGGGQTTFAVPTGGYDVYGQISESDLDRMRSSMVALTGITVHTGQSVTLDARTTVRILPNPPGGTETLMAMFGFAHGLPNGSVVSARAGFALGFQNWQFYRSPPPAVDVGWFDADEKWVLGTRLITAMASGANGPKLNPAYISYLAAPALEGTRSATVVSVGEGNSDDIDRAGVAGKLALARIAIPPGEPSPLNYAFGRAQEITDRAATAGAAGVLFYVDAPGALGLELASSPILQLGLPRDQGVALEQAVARDEVRLTLTGRRTPTDIFRLRFVQPGGASGGYPYPTDWARLTTIRSRYAGDLANLTYQTAWHVFDAHNPTSALLLVPLWGPAEVTEHIAEIGPELRFARQVIQSPDGSALPAAGNFMSRDIITAGAAQQTETWFQSPVRRGEFDGPHAYPFTLRCGLCLDGNRLVAGLHFLDSDPRHYGVAAADGSTLTLFRGARRIPLRGTTTPYFELPDTSSVYRLVQVDQQPLAGTARVFAPRTTTTWTFHPAPAPAGTRPVSYTCPLSGSSGTCGFQPLLTLRYDLGLDLNNRALAGTGLTFDVRVGAHEDALGQGAVAGLRVWASADGGAHWRAAAVAPTGDDRYRVTVSHPATAKSPIWLRMSAWDDRGNTVEQTVESAYGLNL